MLQGKEYFCAFSVDVLWGNSVFFINYKVQNSFITNCQILKTSAESNTFFAQNLLKYLYFEVCFQIEYKNL